MDVFDATRALAGTDELFGGGLGIGLEADAAFLVVGGFGFPPGGNSFNGKFVGFAGVGVSIAQVFLFQTLHCNLIKQYILV